MKNEKKKGGGSQKAKDGEREGGNCRIGKGRGSDARENPIMTEKN